MRKRPKKISDLKSHDQECEALLKFLSLHWEGLGSVKPKGFKELSKDYCDFDGQQEWENTERDKQEKEFKGFDSGERNFVQTVALPQVVYDDICQGRSPMQMLISACVSYGFARGKLYGVKEGKENVGVDLMSFAMKFLGKATE